MPIQLRAVPLAATAAPETDDRSSARSATADWARLLVASGSRVLLLAILGSLLWTAAPAIFGWKPTTVMSDSMAPRVRTGDVVVAMPADAEAVVAALGKVILFDDPDHAGQLRLHRFVGTTDDALLVTRGDANAADDSTPIRPDAVQGIALLRAPYVGLPIVWLAEGKVLLVAASAAAVVGLMALSRMDSHLRRQRGERSVRGPRNRGGRSPLLIGSLAAVSVGFLVVGDGSFAALAATTQNPASSFTTQSTFDCFTGTPTDSPYFYYRFSEGTGTSTADSSVNARNATLQAGVSRAAGGCTGTSPFVGLNGSTANGAITPAGTAIGGPSTYSLEAWFRTSSTTGGKIIGFGSAATGSSGSYDRHLYLTNTGQVIFGAYSTTTNVVTSAAGLNNGQWHHVIATMDSGTLGLGPGMKLYVDGALVGTNPNTTSQNYSGFWRIGYDNIGTWPSAPTSFALSGSLDNVAVYTTALSAARVSAHFAVGH